jgi:hypothetical protein
MEPFTKNPEFDVPVRFDSARMEVTIETFDLSTWGQIILLEVRP